MDDDFNSDNLREGPPRKEWVVQKLPIKGSGVIRSAMQTQIFFRPVTWATIESKVKV